MPHAAQHALEEAVLEAQAIDRRQVADGPGSSRAHRHGRHRLDQLHRRIFLLLAPRIQHLTARYGLRDMEDDARQACAIAIHRAVQSYDRAKASFSTHVTWAMRGELQSLRHRVRLDQRDSAKAAGVHTVSLEGLSTGEGQAVYEIVDDASLARVEQAASDMTTRRALTRLMDRIDSPEHERGIVLEALFERESRQELPAKERERRRQIVRRTFRNCAKAAMSQ